MFNKTGKTHLKFEELVPKLLFFVFHPELSGRQIESTRKRIFLANL